MLKVRFLGPVIASCAVAWLTVVSACSISIEPPCSMEQYEGVWEGRSAEEPAFSKASLRVHPTWSWLTFSIRGTDGIYGEFSGDPAIDCGQTILLENDQATVAITFVSSSSATYRVTSLPGMSPSWAPAGGTMTHCPNGWRNR